MDVVVTVPKRLWAMWIEEGDNPGEAYTGELWDFYTTGERPDCRPGDRVYVVAHGRLRGYAPLVRLDWRGFSGSFVRAGNAVALTIPETIPGFRGWKYRWWEHDQEAPFPDWRTAGVPGAAPVQHERTVQPAGPRQLAMWEG